MVTVSIPTIIEHKTAGYTAHLIGVAIGFACFLIGVREEGVNGFLDGVGATEGADEPRLLTGITELLDLMLGRHFLTLAPVPLAAVLRIDVLRQDLIDVQGLAILESEEILTVAARAWPVEESRQLIGRIVE